MIFRGLFDSSAFVRNARIGKLANWAKKPRLAMLFSPELGFAQQTILPSSLSVKHPNARNRPNRQRSVRVTRDWEVVPIGQPSFRNGWSGKRQLTLPWQNADTSHSVRQGATDPRQGNNPTCFDPDSVLCTF